MLGGVHMRLGGVCMHANTTKKTALGLASSSYSQAEGGWFVVPREVTSTGRHDFTPPATRYLVDRRRTLLSRSGRCAYVPYVYI